MAVRMVSRQAYRFAGGISVAVGQSNGDYTLAIAEHLVTALSVEYELQSVECSPCVDTESTARGWRSRRNVHNCVITKYRTYSTLFSPYITRGVYLYLPMTTNAPWPIFFFLGGGQLKV